LLDPLGMVAIEARHAENPPERRISCWGLLDQAGEAVHPGDAAVYASGA
jgi:hypothetical protein